MPRRSLIQLALGALFALGLASCLSPTLPLPPPEPDSIQEAQAGQWTVSGSCSRGAIVTVFNKTQGHGVVAEDRDETGHYAITIEADLCDTGWVSETLHGETSGETNFVFDKPTGTSSSSCH
jgi:hypothetical protein